jgi:PAS domain S-box-containing protein
MAILNQQLAALKEQEEHAHNIQTGAADLNYLSNDFFLYQDNSKLFDWKSKIAAISNDISKLNSTNPQQQGLVNCIKSDLQNTNVGLSNVVTILWNSPRNMSVRVIPEFQAAWNQTSQNYESLTFDSALLINSIENQANQVNLVNTILAFGVFGLFALYFVVNYLVVYRRTLKSISGLKKGTVIIGSGNLDYQINANQKDEIGELAVAFNQMTSSLKTVTTSKAELTKEIEERKNAEEMLKQAEEKQRTLLNSANVLIQSANSRGEFVYVNEEWKKKLGYNEQDLKSLGIINIIKKDQFEHCMNVFGQVMRGESIHDVETVFVAKDGKEIIVSGNACPIFKNGEFVSTVAFFADITERKKSEEKLKENQARIQSMNEKLRLVSGLTRHDIRNKLAALNGYAYLLKKKHGYEPEIVERLSSIEQSSNEIIKILDFAKMYEQIGVEELSYIDVERALMEAAALFSGLTFKVSNECHGLTVLADSLLRQIFYNFIDNTRKYGNKTTEIRLFYEKATSGELRLIYEDDGVGISSENKLKLFSEGFSTGGSTGFGLFLSKKMIEVYGWKIQETGEPGKGVKFVMSIPFANENGKKNYQITQ